MNIHDGKTLYNRKKLLLSLNMGKINDVIINLINKARSEPKEFADSIMTTDDEDEITTEIAIFFKKFSTELFPLAVKKQLCNTAEALIKQLTKLDTGEDVIKLNKQDRENYAFKKRLLKERIKTSFCKEIVIIGAQNGKEAVLNLLKNFRQREKILSPHLQYIGIASSLLPSERICIVIDLVKEIQHVFERPITVTVNLGSSQSKQRGKRTNKRSVRKLVGNRSESNVFKYRPVKTIFYDYDVNNDRTFSNGFRSNLNNINNNINNIGEHNYSNLNFSRMSVISAKPVPITEYKRIMNPKPRKLKFSETCSSGNFPISGIRKNRGDLSVFSDGLSSNNSLKCCTASKIKRLNNETMIDNETSTFAPVSISMEKTIKKNKSGFNGPVLTRKTVYPDGSMLIHYSPKLKNEEENETSDFDIGSEKE